MHDHDKFKRDMKKSKFQVIDYTGRWFWKGPAVVIERHQLQDVIRATGVKVQRDEMGLGLVVYPAAYDRRKEVTA